MADLAFDAWVEEARSVSLEAYARARSPHLRRQGAEWVGPCPACKGRDRFSISLRKGLWHCREAERKGRPAGGDVIALAMYVEACDFPTACELLTGRPAPGRSAHESEADRAARVARQEARGAQAAAEAAARQKAADARRLAERGRAFAIWHRAGRALAGTPAADYLTLRGLAVPPGVGLRYAPAHPYHCDRGEAGVRAGRRYVVIHTGPALLAGLTGPDGRFAGVHATWIDLGQADGKVRLVHPDTGDALPARKVRGAPQGAHIALIAQPGSDTLLLGEGNETSLSVWQALRETGSPLAERADVWAGINLGNLSGHLAVPERYARVILLGDGDSEDGATREALARAQARLSGPGRHVGVAWAPPGLDFNDLLRGKRPLLSRGAA